MSSYVMIFNTYSMIATMENGQLEPQKYNAFITYGSDLAHFKSSIKMTENDVIIGDKAKDSLNAIFIENLIREFENNKTYSLNGKIYRIKDIVEKYFIEIKKEIDNHIKNVPMDHMTLIIPFKYRKNCKDMLIDIFRKIHFKVDFIIEDAMAGYLGYYETNQLFMPTHEHFMLLDIEYDSIVANIFEVNNTLFQCSLNKICERNNLAFQFYPLLRNYFLKEMSINKDYYELSKNDQDCLDEGINELISAFENRETNKYTLYIGLLDEFIEYEKTYTNNEFVSILSETGILSQITLVVAICMFAVKSKMNKIDRFIYIGPLSTIYGVQERINQYYNVNQNIIENTEKMLCAGLIKDLLVYNIKE